MNALRLARMDVVLVDTHKLRTLATDAESLADELTFLGSPSVGGNPYQPTAKAVVAFESSIEFVAAKLATRMHLTADNVLRSCWQYASQDDRAASEIGSVEL